MLRGAKPKDCCWVYGVQQAGLTGALVKFVLAFVPKLEVELVTEPPPLPCSDAKIDLFENESLQSSSAGLTLSPASDTLRLTLGRL